jgi:hypothetical protein
VATMCCGLRRGAALRGVRPRTSAVEPGRGPVACQLEREPVLRWDSTSVGSVPSLHMEGLVQAVKLRNEERACHLLLRIPVLRAASNTSLHSRLGLGRSTVLAVVFGEKSCVNITRSTSGGDEQEEES